MLDQKFLLLLACPSCHGRVGLAGDDLIGNFNRQIQQGTLKNKGGSLVLAGIEGGLVCEKEQHMYPIRDQIPLMLCDESLPMASSFRG